MDTIEKIKAELEKHPQVRFEADDNSIWVSPASENGFPVGLELEGSGYAVYFSGWHVQFDNEQGAIGCFLAGLTDEYRLKVYSRGDFDYSWTLQWKQGENWVDTETTCLMFFPFWRKKRLRYLSNSLIARP